MAVKKEAVKKPAPKKEAKPASKKAEPKKAPVAKKEVPNYRAYHVVKRQEDSKWEVKFAGGQKAIKLFDTQVQAVEYANKVAESQDGTVLVHNSKGANKGRIKKK